MCTLPLPFKLLMILESDIKILKNSWNVQAKIMNAQVYFSIAESLDRTERWRFASVCARSKCFFVRVRSMLQNICRDVRQTLPVEMVTYCFSCLHQILNMLKSSLTKTVWDHSNCWRTSLWTSVTLKERWWKKQTQAAHTLAKLRRSVKYGRTNYNGMCSNSTLSSPSEKKGALFQTAITWNSDRHASLHF